MTPHDVHTKRGRESPSGTRCSTGAPQLPQNFKGVFESDEGEDSLLYGNEPALKITARLTLHCSTGRMSQLISHRTCYYFSTGLAACGVDRRQERTTVQFKGDET